jgi:hypothetical protein
VILSQILISLALSIQFYQGDLPACEDTCAATNITRREVLECQCKTEECECLPNGLKSSLLTAVIAIPIIGLLNISVRTEFNRVHVGLPRYCHICPYGCPIKVSAVWATSLGCFANRWRRMCVRRTANTGGICSAFENKRSQSPKRTPSKEPK